MKKFSDLQTGERFSVVSPTLAGEVFVKQEATGPDDRCIRCGAGPVWNAVDVADGAKVHVCSDKAVEVL